MLEIVYQKSWANHGIYNNSILREYFPEQVKQHSCYVHVVGQIFVKAGVAKLFDKNTYKFIKIN